MKPRRVVGWRLSTQTRDAVTEYGRQTERSAVGAAEFLLKRALAEAAARGEWNPPDPEEKQ